MTVRGQNPHVPNDAVRQRLAERTLELVSTPSVSRDEAAAMALVSRQLRLEPIRADADVLFATTPRAGRELVVLAGHLDTVPAQENLPGRIDGDAVVGLGASDMKGGLAVMLELADWAADGANLAVDLGFLFFTREELAAEESPVPAFLAETPEIRDAALVIVLEPTDNEIHAGCLGNLNAEITFRGASAHSARPWLGDNAIHRAAAALAPLADADPLDVEVAGLVFREVVSTVRIEGGIADNVVPDRCVARLNYRYAPGRSREAAERRLRELVTGGELAILGNSPPADVVVDRPLVQRLREAGAFDVRPKQAWTPVAQFADAGLDAVNLGPGATGYAHKADERVAIAELARTYDALCRFAGSV